MLTGVSVQGIIHAESGEEGTLANNQQRPSLGEQRQQVRLKTSFAASAIIVLPIKVVSLFDSITSKDKIAID